MVSIDLMITNEKKKIVESFMLQKQNNRKDTYAIIKTFQVYKLLGFLEFVFIILALNF